VVLDVLGEYTDFYGYETCMKNAVEDMLKYITENKITPSSEVEVRITRIASRHRARPIWRENFYAEGYTEFQALNYGSKRDIPDDQETVVWSSREPDTQLAVTQPKGAKSGNSN
jgi:hypothetical protein